MARPRIDLQGSPDGGYALLHGDESQSFPLRRLLNLANIESRAVVPDRAAQESIFSASSNPHVSSPGMFNGVGQCFLNDAIESSFNGAGQPFGICCFDVDRRLARFEMPSARKRTAGIQPRSSRIVGRSSWEYRRKYFSTWLNISLIRASCASRGSGNSRATSASARCTATSSCPASSWTPYAMRLISSSSVSFN